MDDEVGDGAGEGMAGGRRLRLGDGQADDDLAEGGRRVGGVDEGESGGGTGGPFDPSTKLRAGWLRVPFVSFSRLEAGRRGLTRWLVGGEGEDVGGLVATAVEAVEALHRRRVGEDDLDLDGERDALHAEDVAGDAAQLGGGDAAAADAGAADGDASSGHDLFCHAGSVGEVIDEAYS